MVEIKSNCVLCGASYRLISDGISSIQDGGLYRAGVCPVCQFPVNLEMSRAEVEEAAKARGVKAIRLLPGGRL